MKIFDFNIHLTLPQYGVHNALAEETCVDAGNAIFFLENNKPSLKMLSGINLMIFNQNFLASANNDMKKLKSKLDDNFDYYCFTHLFDFTQKNWRDYIDFLAQNHVKFIKFHCYFQGIKQHYFPKIVEICKYAQQKKIGIVICTSYGTSKMFTIESLKLACLVADSITQSPIILLHSGGINVLSAMLLCLDKTNVYLETSFTLPFYIGSSIEKDLAFSYKKMNCDRILYASDHPYVDMEKSVDIHLDFFKRNSFSDDMIEKILFTNAVKLLNE